VEIFNFIKDKGVSLSVLICDEVTLPVINALFKVSEITDKGIGAVVNLSAARERLPGTSAIYFLSPSRESIEALIADYAGKKPRYGDAYVFTAGGKSRVSRVFQFSTLF
jgi:syntaxin-binding protein 1